MAEDINIEQLLIGCKNRQSSYQQQLYKFCFADMIKICLRYNRNMDDAASCYNAAMMKVFLKIDQYNGKGPLLGWIRTIVVNTCITELKNKTKFNHKAIEDIPEENFVPTGTEEDITAKEILQMVQRLPANLSIIFNMYVMEGYNHDEIGKTLGISAGTSKWFLHEARKLLKEKIQQIYYNDTNSKVI